MKIAKIVSYSPDGDNEELENEGIDVNVGLDNVDKAFSESKIRTDRHKELSRCIVENGEVVGGVYTSLTAEDYEEDGDTWRFSFDIAIRPGSRASGGKGLGTRTVIEILDDMMREFESLKAERGRVYCHVWCVNPKLANILEARYGFERGDIGDGQSILTKW